MADEYMKVESGQYQKGQCNPEKNISEECPHTTASYCYLFAYAVVWKPYGENPACMKNSAHSASMGRYSMKFSQSSITRKFFFLLEGGIDLDLNYILDRYSRPIRQGPNSSTKFSNREFRVPIRRYLLLNGYQCLLIKSLVFNGKIPKTNTQNFLIDNERTALPCHKNLCLNGPSQRTKHRAWQIELIKIIIIINK